MLIFQCMTVLCGNTPRERAPLQFWSKSRGPSFLIFHGVPCVHLTETTQREISCETLERARGIPPNPRSERREAIVHGGKKGVRRKVWRNFDGYVRRETGRGDAKFIGGGWAVGCRPAFIGCGV